MAKPSPFAELFEREKPGDREWRTCLRSAGRPLYGERGGVAGIVEAARADLEILLAADVDAVMFCNEGDRPYALQAGPQDVAVPTRLVTGLAPFDPLDVAGVERFLAAARV